MPRITVTSDPSLHGAAAVLFDEHVDSHELGEDRRAMQFIERLGWAISDAEDAEQRTAARLEPSPPAPAVRGPQRERRGARGPIRRGPVAALLRRAFA